MSEIVLLGQTVNSYLHERGVGTITVEHVVAWVGLPGGGRGWLAFRMSAVRGFLGYLLFAPMVLPVALCALVGALFGAVISGGDESPSSTNR